jgi:hypothetical protein
MRTALYLRVSTAQQKPDLQRDDLRSYAERTGLAIITEYTDVAVSGRKEGRPQLHALMQAARMRAFECVLVWKIRSLRTECDAPLTGVGGVQPSADPLYQPSGPDRYAEPHGQSDVYDYWGDGRVGVRTSDSRRRRMLLKINDLPHMTFVNIKSIESITYAFYAASNATSFELTC